MTSSRLDSTKRVRLADVTLVAVSSVAIPATIRALEACLGQVDFAATLFLTDQELPDDRHPDIQQRKIAPIRSLADYSRFMTRSLVDHVETSHLLCVQWDGYLLDSRNWDEQFLAFDYIGAPWPHFMDGHDVGNGGFSLRSRRLLEACIDLPAEADVAEDILIGRVWRDELERRGIRFAPRDVAARFAFERSVPVGNELGFHGVFNLVNLLSAADGLHLIKSLEPELIARNERRELVRWAARRGRWRLLLELANKLIFDRTARAVRAHRRGENFV
ncbi:MAG: DUF5672 family protein [Sphingomicrobium sp.]